MRCLGLNPDNKEMWQYSETTPLGLIQHVDDFIFRSEDDGGRATWTTTSHAYNQFVDKGVTYKKLEKFRSQYIGNHLIFEKL